MELGFSCQNANSVIDSCKRKGETTMNQFQCTKLNRDDDL